MNASSSSIALPSAVVDASFELLRLRLHTGGAPAARDSGLRRDALLVRLRFDADEMTQADLAKRVGVTRQTILAIEKGKYSPSLEVAFKIARIFGVGLEDVFHAAAYELPLLPDRRPSRWRWTLADQRSRQAKPLR